jgi:hypothetical protein
MAETDPHLPPESPGPAPPPDPEKVKVQVAVDVVCMVLSVAAAFAVAWWLTSLRPGDDVFSTILFFALALGAAVVVIFLGVGLRARVRDVLGVADTERRDEPDTSLRRVPPDPDDDDLSEPTVCLVCRHQIPAGAAQCPSCGWTYQLR